MNDLRGLTLLLATQFLAMAPGALRCSLDLAGILTGDLGALGAITAMGTLTLCAIRTRQNEPPAVTQVTIWDEIYLQKILN